MRRYRARTVVVMLMVVNGAARADHPSMDVGQGVAGPITTLSATPLSSGALAVGVRTEYVKSKRYGDDALATLAGQHVHAHSAGYLIGASLGIAYGVTENLTLSASLPYVYRRDIRAGHHSHAGGGVVNSVDALGNAGGIGDLTLLGRYALPPGTSPGQRVALLLGIKTPTGETRESNADGDRFDIEHQPGSGSWDPLIGAALTRRLDRLSLDANLLYTWTTEGAQDTELGDRLAYNIGVSVRRGGATHDHDDGAGHRHAAWDLVLELNGEWEDQHEAAGVRDDHSGGNIVYLSPGARVTAGGWFGSVAVGLPVVQNIRIAHPETDYRVVAGIGRVF